MIIENGKELYSVGEVAKMVGRSIATIGNWYNAEKFAKENDLDFPFELPRPRRDLDKQESRYWTIEQVTKLRYYKSQIKRGDLAQYNVTRWGERGKYIKEKREFKKQMREEVKDIDDII